MTERYFSGGSAERGFSDRQLAPRVADQRCSDTEPRALVVGGAGLWGKVEGLKIRGEVGYRLDGTDPLSGGSSAFGRFAWHIGIGEAY